MSQKNQKQFKLDELETITEFFECFENEADFDDSEMIMYCSQTGKPMFEIVPGKQDRSLSSHGKCEECNMYFSIDALRTPEGMSPARWPVRYIGYTCNDCWNNLPADY